MNYTETFKTKQTHSETIGDTRSPFPKPVESGFLSYKSFALAVLGYAVISEGNLGVGVCPSSCSDFFGNFLCDLCGRESNSRGSTGLRSGCSKDFGERSIGSVGQNLKSGDVVANDDGVLPFIPLNCDEGKVDSPFAGRGLHKDSIVAGGCLADQEDDDVYVARLGLRTTVDSEASVGCAGVKGVKRTYADVARSGLRTPDDGSRVEHGLTNGNEARYGLRSSREGGRMSRKARRGSRGSKGAWRIPEVVEAVVVVEDEEEEQLSVVGQLLSSLIYAKFVGSEELAGKAEAFMAPMMDLGLGDLTGESVARIMNELIVSGQVEPSWLARVFTNGGVDDCDVDSSDDDGFGDLVSGSEESSSFFDSVD